ncbi:MAG: molybdopterin-guanine dinucleotide biosynthesis protein B [Dehalococcoidales bacterium]|jgi:molybdopterin-guanine dinucleotide biosynthesis protein B|nr:molybdopterin-guanine dinucleotide biosynthesis protein B [Dehalococcoidales bacterium]MDD3994764.1 molybdopterin-guanine dinucleotide biosynthesis protein B [Dehalococcoidales bacterium]
MIPVISFVGSHNCGKTTILEKVIRGLKQKGYKVAVIKHHKGDFELDIQGKDTWRLSEAGSDVVAISSPQKTAVIKKPEQELTLDRITEMVCDGMDIVISEGYKFDDKPKIEVFRSEVSDRILSDEKDLVALVTDRRFDIDVPQFSFDDADGIVKLIIEKYLANTSPAGVSLIVNGVPLDMKPFIQDMFINTVSGLVAALHGTENAKEIKITVRLP